MNANEDLAAHITAVAAVARTGLAWSDSLYERERYERIVELAAEMAALMATGSAEADGGLADTLKDGWMAQVTPRAPGYVTPKVSTGAFCFDTDGRLLLGRRGDSGLWFFPTGWQEVGLTPAQNIVKEVREETGVDCRPVRLLAVRDTRLTGSSNPAIHNIALTFLCEALTTEINVHPLETLEAAFFSEADALAIVPRRVTGLIAQGFAAWRDKSSEAYFDPYTE